MSTDITTPTVTIRELRHAQMEVNDLTWRVRRHRADYLEARIIWQRSWILRKRTPLVFTAVFATLLTIAINAAATFDVVPPHVLMLSLIAPLCCALLTLCGGQRRMPFRMRSAVSGVVRTRMPPPSTASNVTRPYSPRRPSDPFGSVSQSWSR